MSLFGGKLAKKFGKTKSKKSRKGKKNNKKRSTKKDIVVPKSNKKLHVNKISLTTEVTLKGKSRNPLEQKVKGFSLKLNWNKVDNKLIE